jgi:hypothetical protein
LAPAAASAIGIGEVVGSAERRHRRWGSGRWGRLRLELRRQSGCEGNRADKSTGEEWLGSNGTLLERLVKSYAQRIGFSTFLKSNRRWESVWNYCRTSLPLVQPEPLAS